MEGLLVGLVHDVTQASLGVAPALRVFRRPGVAADEGMGAQGFGRGQEPCLVLVACDHDLHGHGDQIRLRRQGRGKCDGAGDVGVVTVAEYEDTSLTPDTCRLDSDRLGQFLGLAHLRGVEPEGLLHLDVGVEQLEADAPDKGTYRGHLAVPLHDGGHCHLRRQSPFDSGESRSGSGSS